ncbi:hypothetical protein ACN38_g12979, partial [Penicillium nordicum]
MNTLGKLLEAVIASRISWAVEEHHLLPDTHLGGRKGISVDHAIQLILDRVHQAWGNGRKVSMLLLDVSGAYDNVSHQRLLHNMRMLGLGHFVPWVQSFLTGRSTRIKLPGFISELFNTETGIPQGSPISPILFLLFNTPLVQGCHIREPDGAECHGYGWVDDVAMIVESQSYARNVEVLQIAFDKADTWARRHAAKFAPDKFELIHFTNPREPPVPPALIPQNRQNTPDIYDIIVENPGDDQMPVQAANQTIQPSNSAKYLGIWLDKTLQFHTHYAKLSAKGNSSLEALRGMSGSTWGAPLIAMRMVYQAVVVPQMLYGVAAWYSPAARTTAKPEENRIINMFTGIQRRAAILIAGAFKSMSAAALNIELYLLPIRLQMQQIIEETAIRIQTGAKWAQPECLTARQARRSQDAKRGGLSPLEALQKKGQVLERQLGVTWESRTAFVLAPWEPRIRCVIEDAETAIKSHDAIQSKATYAEVEAAMAEIEPHLSSAPAPSPLIFFTDGSGYEEQIGAAAVAPHAKPPVFKRQHLGSSEQSTVYIAELSGIEMAIYHFSESHPQTPRELVIFADSQAAIQAVQNPKRPSGQYALHAIYTHIRALTPSLSVTIRWIPAHIGVSGNELADAAAKEAAKDRGADTGAGSEVGFSGSGTCPKLRLATTAKRQVRAQIRAEWAKQWAREKTGKPNQRLVGVPNKRVLKLFEGLS